MKDLTEINKFDLELWDYAQSLVALRLKEVPALVKQADQLDVLAKKNQHLEQRFQCNAPRYHLPGPLAVQTGVFRPVGHKGPLP